jgi:hypothetical protein
MRLQRQKVARAGEIVEVCKLGLPHLSGDSAGEKAKWYGEEAEAAASRGRGALAYGHTACHPLFTEGQSARPSLGALPGQRARPEGAGGHRYCGTRSPATGKVWSNMVWYGAPPTPRQCVLSLRVVASCSVHPVSE